MRNIFLFTFFFSCIISCHSQRVKDTTAIRLLLEKESATWRSGDSRGHASCWEIRPYSTILVSIGDGTVIDVPPIMMTNTPVESMGKGGYSKNTNYKMSIKGKRAWVSHDEESVSKDGKSTFSKEIRLLEKIRGKWKLVGQSIHIQKF